MDEEIKLAKELKTMDEIIIMINAGMAESDALDGDCKGCRVSGVYKLKDQEDIDRLGRNWELSVANKYCTGECLAVLEYEAKKIARLFDVI